MNEGIAIVKKGQVESIMDDADGLRIKVRIDDDGNKPLADIPYAFPLIPKAFQSVPRFGEGAFVLLSMSGDKNGQRYYLGPIISQPQFNEYDEYNGGRGNATSVLKGGFVEPLEKISNFKSTYGSFPKIDDIAVVGRGGQDIILRNEKNSSTDEVDIRCGIRTSMPSDESDNENNGLRGKVLFNNVDPSYVQLKYKQNITTAENQEANSVINMVADKLNLISHKDEHCFNLTDNETLIREEELDKIMSELHQLAHGDTLIKLLKIIVMAIITHVHPYAGMTPIITNYVRELVEFDLESILSKHVRVS